MSLDSLQCKKKIKFKMNIDYIKATFGYIGFIPFAILAIIPWILGGAIAHMQ